MYYTRKFFNFLAYNPWFIIKSGFKSRTGYNGGRMVFKVVFELGLFGCELMFFQKNVMTQFVCKLFLNLSDMLNQNLSESIITYQN